METKPLVENLTKKVVIKTIETRDGHVCKNYKALTLQNKYLKEKNQYKMIPSFSAVLLQVINESSQHHEDLEWTAYKTFKRKAVEASTVISVGYLFLWHLNSFCVPFASLDKSAYTDVFWVE